MKLYAIKRAGVPDLLVYAESAAAARERARGAGFVISSRDKIVREPRDAAGGQFPPEPTGELRTKDG